MDFGIGGGYIGFSKSGGLNSQNASSLTSHIAYIQNNTQKGFRKNYYTLNFEYYQSNIFGTYEHDGFYKQTISGIVRKLSFNPSWYPGVLAFNSRILNTGLGLALRISAVYRQSGQITWYNCSNVPCIYGLAELENTGQEYLFHTRLNLGLNYQVNLLIKSYDHSQFRLRLNTSVYLFEEYSFQNLNTRNYCTSMEIIYRKTLTSGK